MACRKTFRNIKPKNFCNFALSISQTRTASCKKSTAKMMTSAKKTTKTTKTTEWRMSHRALSVPKSPKMCNLWRQTRELRQSETTQEWQAAAGEYKTACGALSEAVNQLCLQQALGYALVCVRFRFNLFRFSAFKRQSFFHLLWTMSLMSFQSNGENMKRIEEYLKVNKRVVR